MGLKTELSKLKHTVMTQVNSPETMSLSEEMVILLCLLDPGQTLKQDRQAELAEYWQCSTEEVLQRYEDFHVNKSRRKPKDSLDVSTDEGVFAHYRQEIEQHLTKKMLAYTRFDMAYKLLKYLNAYYPPAKRPDIRVLDYGCGVADYALAFAAQGYHPVICDIPGSHLDFAQWRFKKRDIPYTAISVTENNLYPDLGKVDIAICGEVLEHVRNPLKVIQSINQSMPRSGFFWSSGFPDDEREVGGTHLPEAAELRLESVNYLHKHFKKIKEIRHLYRK